MPAPFIRVKDKATGHEFSIREYLFDGDAHTKADRPAVGPDGEIVPPKFKTSVAKSAAAKKAGAKPDDNGHQADTEKE